MRLDTSFIAAMSARLRELCGDDDDLLADMIEGETDAMELADRLIAAMQEAEALANAVRAQIDPLVLRHCRIDARADAIRRQLLPLLDAMGLKKIERPRATVSRRAGSVSVRITDEASVPRQLCVAKLIETPDKKAIKAQLEAGETVPGAELVRGEDGVTVRIA